MALNFIWFAFFMVAFAIALFKWIITGDVLIFKTITDGVFKSAGDSVDLSFKLIGIMTLFLGFMNIGEKAGAIRFLSRIVAPFFGKLFPEVPKGHPAMGQMMMNFSANLLGLDNAATPFGLKAMDSLQSLNPNKDSASNSQIMFLVLHASGLTLIPISIIAMRASVNPPAANPTDIFIPCMIATFAATLAALIIVSIKQKINLLHPQILSWILGISIIIGLLISYLKFFLSKVEIENFSAVLSNGLILLIFVVFLTFPVQHFVETFLVRNLEKSKIWKHEHNHISPQLSSLDSNKNILAWPLVLSFSVYQNELSSNMLILLSKLSCGGRK